MENPVLPNNEFKFKTLNQIVVEIIKNNFLMICVILLGLCGTFSLKAIILSTNEHTVVRIASSLFSECVSNSLRIVILLMAYKSIKGNDFDLVIPTIKRTLIPYIVTIWIVKIIVGFLMGIVAIVISGFMLVFRNYTMTVVLITLSILKTLSIISIALYFLVRYAFALQMVVFDKKYYADALNRSEQMSQGHRKIIKTMIIIPIIIMAVGSGILAISSLSILTKNIVLGILNTVASIYSLIITSVLYFKLKE